MATKTISVDLEAYERLRQARRNPEESFSRVIKRAEWPEEVRTAAGLLKAMEGHSSPDQTVIDQLDEAQAEDRPPEEQWPSG